MGWLHNWKLRRAGLVTVPLYAPDIALSAVDYIDPVPPERRIAQAEKRIQQFLKNTAPDQYNGDFFDALTEQEEQLLIAMLREQTPRHQGVNGAIALKHQSELVRLRLAINQTQELVRQLDTEIAQLQDCFLQHN